MNVPVDGPLSGRLDRMGVDARISGMLNRGSLQWKWSVGVRKFLSSVVDGSGDFLWVRMKVGVGRSLNLARIIMDRFHTLLLLGSGTNGRTSLNILGLPTNRAWLLLLDGGMRSNTSLSRMLNVATLSLNNRLGN